MKSQQQVFMDRNPQQIVDDSTLWKNVNIKIKNEWIQCLSSIQTLETNIQEAIKTRSRYYRYFRYCNGILKIVTNVVAAIASVLGFIQDVPREVAAGLNVFLLILTLAFWTKLEKRAEVSLKDSRDLNVIKQLCRTMRRKLVQIMEDGRITSNERADIRDMMTLIFKKSEEIGTMDTFIRILSQSYDSKNDDRQQALDRVQDLISGVSGKSVMIAQSYPQALRESLLDNHNNNNNGFSPFFTNVVDNPVIYSVPMINRQPLNNPVAASGAGIINVGAVDKMTPQTNIIHK